MNFKKYLYCFLLVICYSTIYGAVNPSCDPVAKNGVIDFRGQQFKTDFYLNGEWKFYWLQLVKSSDQLPGKGAIVNFPFKWTGAILNGEKLPAFGYATYQVMVLLPKIHAPLRISLPDSYSSYRLFINDKEVLSNGRVSSNPKDFIPHWQYKAVDIPQNTDTLKILLQVANFAHSRGGIKDPLVIGTKERLDLKRQRAASIDLLLTGCLFMGGLFFLGLYLLGSRDRAILFFSLFCMVYCYRIMGVNNYALHSMLPDLSWYITVKIEYITLFMGVCLFGVYTRYLYPEDINKTILTIISLICFVFATATLFLPPLFFTQLVNPFLIVAIFCLVYTPYVYLRAYRNKRPGSAYALTSSFALMVVFTLSLLHYWSIIPYLQLVSFGAYVSFFFLQSLVLSHRVSFLLKKARQEAELGLIAKSEFLSTMSHEIRTPLNAVIGMSHLLLKNNPREDQRKELDVMLFSANNLLAIVNDILDYNKIEAGKVSFEHIEMDVALIAKNIVSGLQSTAEDRNIDLNLHIDPKLEHKLLGDPTRFSQVITNLVHNAIKFTTAGYVELSINVKDQSEKNIELIIKVKDTGIGISKEKQKLIFERFTQADSSTSRGFGGTGLGLAISKKLLELQQSSLQLISEAGKGSCFFFVQTFEKSIKPSIQDTVDHKNIKEADKPLTGVAILLVEDNAMNVLVAQSFLQRWGAQVDVAENGAEALIKLDVNRHQLILMDLHMPVMDGYEASEKIRELGINLPIIALTANIPNEIQVRVKQSGINDIVVKPFLPDELYRKVLHYLNP